MDPVRNPYQPGAGLKPAALVGRDAPLSSWTVALNRVAVGRSTRPFALYGLRGVGKTVLLNRFASEARERDWIVAKIEAGAGKTLRDGLAEQLYGPLTDMAGTASKGRRLLQALKTAASFHASVDAAGTWKFNVDLSGAPGGGADTGSLEPDLSKLLRDLSAAVADLDSGVAVLIDEAQDLTADELVALCAVAHQAGQEEWRVLIALAGLPSLPRVLAEAKSYSERLFTFEMIEQLDTDVASRALTEPAASEGVQWEHGAVQHVVAETGGYPYFLQQFGKEAWDEAEGVDAITVADARVGAARGQSVLDSGFFRARWDRATRAEQRYLRAMAQDGDAGSTAAAVAARLGRKVQSQGPARASLIGKGLIYAPEHGVVSFTVPGMAGFIARQPEL